MICIQTLTIQGRCHMAHQGCGWTGRSLSEGRRHGLFVRQQATTISVELRSKWCITDVFSCISFPNEDANRIKSWTFWNHYMSSLDELCELEGIPLNPQDLTQVCPEAVSLDPSKFHSWGFRNRWVLQWSFILKPCDLKHITLAEKKDAAAYPALNLLVSPCESIRWSCSTWKAGKFVISRPWMQRMRNKS